MTTIVKPHGRKVYAVPIPQTGQLGFYRDYKEPLVPLETGYGYDGVLLYDIGMEKVQCHFCGGWFQTLGTHIIKHGMNAKSYREEYGLGRMTALISEKNRIPRIANGLRLYSQNRARTDWKERHRHGSRNGTGKRGPKRAEVRNRAGTCAAQLIAWLKANPEIRLHEQGSMEGPIIQTFGSWNRARALAGLVERGRKPVDKKVALASLRSFFEKNGRTPRISDANRGLLLYSSTGYMRAFGSWNQALSAAGLETRDAHTGAQRFTESYADWIAAYTAGEMVTEIAKKAKANYATVRQVLKTASVFVPYRDGGFRRKPMDLPAAARLVFAERSLNDS